MQVIDTRIPEVKILIPKRFEDRRGFFSETFSKRTLADASIELAFVQDNHSMSVKEGTIRGLHYQIPPFAQDKLVQVVRGAILDVAVDLRRSSATFGEHVAVEISAERWNQILVPIGFAHGFCTLEPLTEVIYKVTNYYAPEYERGLLWKDPALGIDWPFPPDRVVSSERDKKYPRLADLAALFD